MTHNYRIFKSLSRTVTDLVFMVAAIALIVFTPILIASRTEAIQNTPPPPQKKKEKSFAIYLRRRTADSGKRQIFERHDLFEQHTATLYN